MSQLISITHQPPQFTPVYTDGLFFTIITNDFNKPKFRYVYEVYVDNQVIFTGKCTPNPFGLGIVDISGILKNYVSNLPLSYFESTPIYTHETFPFSRPLDQNVILYNVKFGYEFAIDEISPVLQYSGFGTFIINTDTNVITLENDLGSPSVDSGLFKTYHATMGVNGRADQQDFDMNPFILSGTPMNTNPTTSGLFLTNSPRTRNIQPTEYYTLGFTNYYLDSVDLLSQPYYAEYKYYDENGQLIDTRQYLNIFSNGGGPLSDCISVYQSLFTIVPKTNTEFNTLYLGCGPNNIDGFPDNTAQYTVQLFGNFTGTTQPPPTSVPFPTPTPTPIPCIDCKTYSITNNSQFASALYSYRDCDTLQLQNNILPPQSSFGFCACKDSFVEETGILDVIIEDACGPKPCATCEFVTVYNNNSNVSVVFDYWDCEFGPSGGWRKGSLNPLTGNQYCACPNSFDTSTLQNIVITPQGSCAIGPPPPTPTPPCEFIEHVVQLVSNTCDNGVCSPTVIGTTKLYTDCDTLTPFQQNAKLYANSDLTVRFQGTFTNGVVIYIAFPVPLQNYSFPSLICVVGGPC